MRERIEVESERSPRRDAGEIVRPRAAAGSKETEQYEKGSEPLALAGGAQNPRADVLLDAYGRGEEEPGEVKPTVQKVVKFLITRNPRDGAKALASVIRSSMISKQQAFGDTDEEIAEFFGKRIQAVEGAIFQRFVDKTIPPGLLQAANVRLTSAGPTIGPAHIASGSSQARNEWSALRETVDTVLEGDGYANSLEALRSRWSTMARENQSAAGRQDQEAQRRGEEE